MHTSVRQLIPDDKDAQTGSVRAGLYYTRFVVLLLLPSGSNRPLGISSRHFGSRARRSLSRCLIIISPRSRLPTANSRQPTADSQRRRLFTSYRCASSRTSTSGAALNAMQSDREAQRGDANEKNADSSCMLMSLLRCRCATRSQTDRMSSEACRSIVTVT